MVVVVNAEKRTNLRAVLCPFLSHSSGYFLGIFVNTSNNSVRKLLVRCAFIIRLKNEIAKNWLMVAKIN